MKVTKKQYLGDQCILKPTGVAATDVVNIRYAFDNYRNVRFENCPGWGIGFVIDEPIIVDPLDYDPLGRTVEFNNCYIRCVDKESTPPTNAFIFRSLGYPNGLRNTKITGSPVFDGEVSGAFLKIEGGSIWNLTVEDIFASYGAIADALVEFCSNEAGSNAGACEFRNMATHTHIKYTLKFTVADGGDTQFDDFIIENIQNYYTDAQGGAAVYLDNDAKLVYCNIRRIINVGNGDAIGGDGYLYDCDVNGIYMECKGTSAYGIKLKWADGCTFNHVWLRLDEAVTTTSRTVQGILTRCECNHHRITAPDGTRLTSTYITEDATSAWNTYNNVAPVSRVAQPMLYFASGLFGIGCAPECAFQVNARIGEKLAGLFGTPDYVAGSAGSSLQIDFGAASGNTYTRFSALSAGAGAWNDLVFQSNGGRVGIGTLAPTSVLHVVGLPTHANNAAAVGAGLTPGAFYRTGGDPDTVCVVH